MPLNSLKRYRYVFNSWAAKALTFGVFFLVHNSTALAEEEPDSAHLNRMPAVTEGMAVDPQVELASPSYLEQSQDQVRIQYEVDLSSEPEMEPNPQAVDPPSYDARADYSADPRLQDFSGAEPPRLVEVRAQDGSQYSENISPTTHSREPVDATF